MSNAITASPLFGIVLTLAAFLIGIQIQKKTGSALCNPLVIAIALCMAVLTVLRIPMADYRAGGDIINLFVGPATAVLALNIYQQRKVLQKYFIPVLVGCVLGSLTSVGSITILCRLFGLDDAVSAALLPKSVTTPIAIGIAEGRGGIVAITMVAVLITGLTGAVAAPLFAKWFHVQDPVAQGLAIGASSHALGTTKAIEIGELQGAMSGIAIGVCGIFTVILCLFL